MDDFIKVNDEYKPVTYISRPSDPFWEQRESIEVNIPDFTYEEAFNHFKDGKWSLYRKVEKVVYDEREDPEEPIKSHTETDYEERDMSDYCVCGWVRNNLDGSCSVKMGVLSELEKLIEAMLGGV